MKCPNCGSTVGEDQKVCSHCGKELPAAGNDFNGDLIDNDLVFSYRDMPKKRKSSARNVIILVIAVLLICAVVLGVMWFLRGRNSNEQKTPAATVATTEAPASGATEAPATNPQPTTVPPATVPAATVSKIESDNEKKLTDYVNKIGLYNTLAAACDDKTTLSMMVEGNTVVAKYTVSADSNDGEQYVYFTELEDSFGEFCSSLDGTVYEIKEKSGVSKAVLEVTVTDVNNDTVFSQSID